MSRETIDTVGIYVDGKMNVKIGVKAWLTQLEEVPLGY
jgi:hypothetical protein